jgi:hypothetical protein
MGNLLSRAEHYRKQAVKYHELAKVARPPYLGDFYRGVAVRYIFMAQEISKQGENEAGFATELSPAAELSRAAECEGEDASRVAQDLDLLSVWAGDRLPSDGSE